QSRSPDLVSQTCTLRAPPDATSAPSGLIATVSHRPGSECCQFDFTFPLARSHTLRVAPTAVTTTGALGLTAMLSIGFWWGNSIRLSSLRFQTITLLFSACPSRFDVTRTRSPVESNSADAVESARKGIPWLDCSAPTLRTRAM